MYASQVQWHKATQECNEDFVVLCLVRVQELMKELDI